MVSWFVRSRLSIGLTLSCSCFAACSTEPTASTHTSAVVVPVPDPAPPEPEPPEPAPPEPEEDDELEQADVELHEVPFEADLDADTRPESISWTCSVASAELRVGRTKYRAKLGFADLIGCAVAVVDLDPDVAGGQLWLHADEHDEAGPNRNFLVRHADGKLEEIWSDDLDFDLYVDGSWHTEESVCDETQRVHRTTTTVWRWREQRLVDEAKVSTVPMAEGERCDDESEP